MDISQIATPAITAGAAVLAVVIGNRLSYSRTYQEKLWDLRRPAYGQILSELAAIEQICDNADEYISQDSDRYFGDADSLEQRDNKAIAIHFDVIRKRLADDYLILSDAFISVYEQMLKAMSGDPYGFDPPADHERFSSAIRKYRPLLISLARGEMTPRKNWIFRS